MNQNFTQAVQTVVTSVTNANEIRFAGKSDRNATFTRASGPTCCVVVKVLTEGHAHREICKNRKAWIGTFKNIGHVQEYVGHIQEHRALSRAIGHIQQHMAGAPKLVMPAASKGLMQTQQVSKAWSCLSTMDLWH